MQEKYNMTGMSCAACSSRVEKAVSALPGMKECSVNLLKNSMVVQYDEKTLTGTDIIQAVEKADTRLPSDRRQKKATSVSTEQSVSANAAKKEYETMKRRVIWSFVFTVPLFTFPWERCSAGHCRDIFGNGKFYDLRVHPVFTFDSGRIYQFQILPCRI